MISNQVRYNSTSSQDYSRCLNWFFLIINNDDREISRIKNSIFNLFAPIIEGTQNYEGKFPKGFKYNLFNFYSQKRPEQGWKKKIYKKLLKDNNLYRRKNIDGLENYVSDMFS